MCHQKKGGFYICHPEQEDQQMTLKRMKQE
nr:MAG TPA: regulator protein [Caudoviricetes sp.]